MEYANDKLNRALLLILTLSILCHIKPEFPFWFIPFSSENYSFCISILFLYTFSNSGFSSWKKPFPGLVMKSWMIEHSPACLGCLNCLVDGQTLVGLSFLHSWLLEKPRATVAVLLCMVGILHFSTDPKLVCRITPVALPFSGPQHIHNAWCLVSECVWIHRRINGGVSIWVLASLSMKVKDQVFLCQYLTLTLDGVLVRLSVKDFEAVGAPLVP